MKSSSWLSTSVAVLILLATTGCSRSSDRVAIEGTVSVDGRPLDAGAISFTPEQGTVGPTAGGTIVAGRFQIPAAGGPVPGDYRVTITAVRTTADTVPDDFGAGMKPVSRQFLPSRYNDQSTLRAEIRAGGTPLTFELESR